MADEEKPERAEPNASKSGSGVGTTTGWLAVGLATMTAALTAVGSLTGGIARMFRNYEWPTIVSFGLVLFGVLFAIVAAVLPGGTRQVLPRAFVVLGAISFVGGVMLAITLMVAATGKTDRPALSAQLAKDATGAWSVKGTARTSGLKTKDKMSVYLYSLPPNTDNCNKSGVTTSTPTPSATSSPTSSTEPPGGASPSPTLTPAKPPTAPIGSACGQRVFYALTGPDQDGVAVETFEVPLPEGEDVSAFVLTANLGSEPRNCEGVAFKAQVNPGDDSPPVAQPSDSTGPASIPSSAPSESPQALVGARTKKKPLDVEREQTACITFTSPPTPSPTTTKSPSVPTPKHVVTLMSDVGFDRDSAVLTPAGRAAISRLAARLRNWNIRATIEVHGYTDNLGSAAHGQRLSQRRADAVADRLRAKLRASHFQIVTRGFGERNPIASNLTENGRRQNRRVTVVFSVQSG
jgi:outer membrane protein OmpA-like peptidoglycan-associated protein